MLTGKRHPGHIKRFREIALTLARHGLGWLALQLNLGMFIPFHWGLLGHPRRPEPYTHAQVRLRVPRIYWEYSTRRVLTMEEISGIKVSDFESLEKTGLDRRRIAENCAHIILTMAYDHGFFHADPHPGNIFILPGEVVAVLDYGMVGMIDDALKTALLRIFLALTRGDARRLADEFLLLGIARTPVRRHVFKRDIERLIQLFYDKPLKEIMATLAFHEFMAIARRHRLQLPSDLIMLFKVVAMSEGLGARLDPEFKLMEFAEPYFKRFWLKGRSPRRQARRAAEGMRELVELGLDLPAQARRMLGQMERGEMTFVPRLEGLEEALKGLQKAWNRVSMSILTAALIVGLGLLMLIYHPPGWEKFAGWFFGLLFVVTAVFGIGLLWSIWRSRDR